jgi:predicted Fe-Mo cluster-binding NifX family protein
MSQLERQVIHLAAANAELLMALEEIAKKKKMDAVAAVSMKAIAVAALSAAGIKVR